jgi:hypothetical protein
MTRDNLAVPTLALCTAALLASLVAISCAPPTAAPPTPPEAAAPHEQLAVDPVLAERGVLQIFVTDQLTDGRNLKIRGRIRNPYDQRVDGVRLVLRILSMPGSQGHELDRFQQVVDEPVAAGEQIPLRLDVQTMYGSFGGLTLQAFAIRRGGQTLPLPPEWKE